MCEITNDQFEVLRCLVELKKRAENSFSFAEAGNLTQIDHSVICELLENGYLFDNYEITPKAIKHIAQFKVDNAIIMAAGKGTRFIPFSLKKPKCLAVVKGEVLLERQIRQLKEAGIEDVIIVAGYLKEQLSYLVDKFGVKIIVNDDYQKKNTHSSLYYARNYLKNSYILCADIYYPESLFHEYEYHSLYSIEYLDDYSMEDKDIITNRDGLIISASQHPNVNRWVSGYAFFDRYFSDRFKKRLEEIYEIEGTDHLYWEQIYAMNINELPMYLKQYGKGHIMEFDTLTEVIKFDLDFMINNP